MDHRPVLARVLMVAMVTIAAAPPLIHAQDRLSSDFYSASCPNVESIVTTTMNRLSSENNVVPIGMLRLFAHDCFVEGCDASILLTGASTERAATDNLDFPQNPFDAMDELKKTVEESCPGVVSCADILAMATRDAVTFSGGPSWTVLKGRLDGTISRESRVAGHLPGADFDVEELESNFGALGLSLEDMVVLSGAHTIGFSHCHQFTSRLYGSSGSDPSLSPSFVSTLQKQCPQFGGNPTTVQAFDISTPFAFDNLYYKHLLTDEGLLVSDSTLTTRNDTLRLVNLFANSQEAFFSAFARSMVRLGSVGVKTRSGGEIRRVCSRVN
ncbi:peroxidase A2 [Selaginella moellendorffii]|nr:peroxidase A2 [Selaginella moellendorffii]|eukprot:XP_002971841.2 peroxidase A2 [Selaginella moellendorffii]